MQQQNVNELQEEINKLKHQQIPYKQTAKTEAADQTANLSQTIPEKRSLCYKSKPGII